MRPLKDSLIAQAALLAQLADEALAPELERIGLSQRMFELLSAIKASGTAPQAEIARRLGVAPPSLTEALQLAAKQGWLQQVASADDQRAKRVELLPKAEKALKQAAQAIATLELELAASLGSDAKTAADLLRDANTFLAKRTSL